MHLIIHQNLKTLAQNNMKESIKTSVINNLKDLNVYINKDIVEIEANGRTHFKIEANKIIEIYNVYQIISELKRAQKYNYEALAIFIMEMQDSGMVSITSQSGSYQEIIDTLTF